MSDHPCPKCGHCPTCGRSNAPVNPWAQPRITYYGMTNNAGAANPIENYTFTANV